MASDNGSIHFQQGVTIQIGGPGSFEYVRLDVGITLPIISQELMQSTMRNCVSFVERNLEEQLREAKGQTAPKLGSKKKSAKKRRKKVR